LRLPNAPRAIIAREKLRDYLLWIQHPFGGGKAPVLIRFGYTRAGWRRLQEDIFAEVQSRPTSRPEATAYGNKYVVLLELPTPSGRKLSVVSVWLVPTGERRPRFVTLYPRSA